MNIKSMVEEVVANMDRKKLEAVTVGLALTAFANTMGLDLSEVIGDDLEIAEAMIEFSELLPSDE